MSDQSNPAMPEHTGDILPCPKCGESMRQLTLDEDEKVVVDRCTGCYGFWLDEGERSKMMANTKLTRVVDIGPEVTGDAYNEVTDIQCPRCKVQMKHVQHPDQKHVEFESCPQCRGSYFDAGELRDLSSISLGDFVKNFFGG